MAPGALLLFFAVILFGFVLIGLVGVLKNQRERARAQRPKRRPQNWPNQN